MHSTLDIINVEIDSDRKDEILFNLLLSLRAEVSNLTAHNVVLLNLLMNESILPGESKQSLLEMLNTMEELNKQKQYELTAWLVQKYGK